MCKADISHPRARASTRGTPYSNHARDRTSKSKSAPAAVAKTLDAEEDASEGTEARPGSLSTSTTALPCYLGSRKSGRGERNDRDGQGMQAGVRGWARADSSARQQFTLTIDVLSQDSSCWNSIS